MVSVSPGSSGLTTVGNTNIGEHRADLAQWARVLQTRLDEYLRATGAVTIRANAMRTSERTGRPSVAVTVQLLGMSVSLEGVSAFCNPAIRVSIPDDDLDFQINPSGRVSTFWTLQLQQACMSAIDSAAIDIVNRLHQVSSDWGPSSPLMASLSSMPILQASNLQEQPEEAASMPVDEQREVRAPILAVFDVEVKGVSLNSSVTDRLTDVIGTRLTEARRFQVVPRDQIRLRLWEQKVSSYQECFDQTCQIELGREQAAEKSLSTRIVRLGKSCMVTLTIFDLARATSDEASSALGGCDEAAVVSTLLEAIDKLTGLGGSTSNRIQETVPTPGGNQPDNCLLGQVTRPEWHGNCCWPGQGWNGTLCVGRPISCPTGYQVTETDCIKQPCLDGRIRVDGLNCCWVGQGWNGTRCVGKPRGCPSDMISTTDDCVFPPCGGGRVRVDGRYCCWPSQVWSFTESSCSGIPHCPIGFRQNGMDCTVTLRTVNDIVALFRDHGFTEEDLIAMIASSDERITLSTLDVIVLTDSKIPETVIKLLLSAAQRFK